MTSFGIVVTVVSLALGILGALPTLKDFAKKQEEQREQRRRVGREALAEIDNERPHIERIASGKPYRKEKWAVEYPYADIREEALKLRKYYRYRLPADRVVRIIDRRNTEHLPDNAQTLIAALARLERTVKRDCLSTR